MKSNLVFYCFFLNAIKDTYFVLCIGVYLNKNNRLSYIFTEDMRK